MNPKVLSDEQLRQVYRLLEKKDRIEALLQELGYHTLTYKAIAETVGCSLHTIWRLHNGDNHGYEPFEVDLSNCPHGSLWGECEKCGW